MTTDLVTQLRDVALGCMPTRELAMQTNYWLAADAIERLDADCANERAEKESLRDQVRQLTSENAQLRQDLAQQTANTRTVLELQAEVERLTSELAQAKGIISVLAQWPGIAAVRKETIGTLTQERDEAIRVLATALTCDGYDLRHAEWMAEAIRIVGPRNTCTPHPDDTTE